MLLAGFLVERFSVTTTIMLIAGGYFLVTAAQIFNKTLGELDGGDRSDTMSHTQPGAGE